MKRKPFLSAAALLLAAVFRLGALPAGEDRSGEKTSPLSLEAYGAFAAVRPADLNLLAGYYNAYPLFFYSAQYDYLHAQTGGRFAYSSVRSGGDRLEGIRGGFPGGLRLKYSVSASFSLSLGLEYLGLNRLSDTTIRYQIEDRSGGLIQTTPQEVDLGYPGFFLGASAWIPQIGVHWSRPLGRGWRLGAALSAGPLLARCRSVLETSSRSRYVNGYWSENRSLLEMKGSATGLAVELSVELRRRLSRRLSFFLAPGYAWRRAAAVEGSGHNLSLAVDSNAVQDLVENSWNGRWRKKDVFYQRNWGQFSETYYGNYFSASEADGDFALDLSGLQLKAGLSWVF